MFRRIFCFVIVAGGLAGSGVPSAEAMHAILTVEPGLKDQYSHHGAVPDGFDLNEVYERWEIDGAFRERDATIGSLRTDARSWFDSTLAHSQGVRSELTKVTAELNGALTRQQTRHVQEINRLEDTVLAHANKLSQRVLQAEMLEPMRMELRLLIREEIAAQLGDCRR